MSHEIEFSPFAFVFRDICITNRDYFVGVGKKVLTSVVKRKLSSMYAFFTYGIVVAFAKIIIVYNIDIA